VKSYRIFKLLLSSAAIMTVLSGQAHAQDYPNHAIRLLVPFPPGGGTDIIARLVASKMAPGLGAQIVIDNRPGANTQIATEATARAAPDGYTLLIETFSTPANVTLYAGKKTFNPLKDLSSISLIVAGPQVLLISPTLPAKNLKEFIALAKAKPNVLTYASGGNGSINHISSLYLNMLAGVTMVHVPYKGTNALMPDLMAGRIDSTILPVAAGAGFVKSKQARGIAVTSRTRYAGLPDIPTIAEQGYPSYDFPAWFGLTTAAGTPRAVVDRLQKEVVRALKDPGLEATLVANGYQAIGSTPAEFDTFIRKEIDKTAVIIKASGATVE
jgi:tripartite-type tricarboxylate transporter receptor subunit TctC